MVNRVNSNFWKKKIRQCSTMTVSHLEIIFFQTQDEIYITLRLPAGYILHKTIVEYDITKYSPLAAVVRWCFQTTSV